MRSVLRSTVLALCLGVLALPALAADKENTLYIDLKDNCRVVIEMRPDLAPKHVAQIKKLARGSIIEIRTSEPRRATSLLRENMPSATVGLFGDRIHMTAVDAELTMRRVTELLAKAGLVLDEVRTIEPALEDVFVSLLGEGSKTDR